VYLTVDQAQVRVSGGFEKVFQVGQRAAAGGLDVDIWESAHSLRAGLVCLTAWWESLAALEAASNTLRYVEMNEDRDHDDRAETLMEPVVQRLLTVISGPTQFDQTHRYLRILEVSGLKDMQAVIDNGVELAEKVTNTTGVSMTVLRNVTGFSRDMMFLSTYEGLAQYEEAGHHLQATSYWLHQRGQYANVLDGTTLTMNLFRRVGRK
jgi:hypothetical protein